MSRERERFAEVDSVMHGGVARNPVVDTFETTLRVMDKGYDAVPLPGSLAVFRLTTSTAVRDEFRPMVEQGVADVGKALVDGRVPRESRPTLAAERYEALIGDVSKWEGKHVTAIEEKARRAIPVPTRPALAPHAVAQIMAELGNADRVQISSLYIKASPGVAGVLEGAGLVVRRTPSGEFVEQELVTETMRWNRFFNDATPEQREKHDALVRMAKGLAGLAGAVRNAARKEAAALRGRLV
jgi:hypothetical protein